MSNGHTDQQRAAMSAAMKQAWADGKYTRTDTHNENIRQAVADHWQRHFRDRVLSKVDMSGGPTACWRWMGAKDSKGYGRAKHKGRVVKSHRVVYEFLQGVVLDERDLLLHHCAPNADNPACCNPAHLRTGTLQENCRDAVRKGQVRQGERHHASKFTIVQVMEARDAYRCGAKATDLAARYKTSVSVLMRAVHGDSWQSVPGAVAKKADSRAVKLTMRLVCEMRERYANGVPIKQLALTYKVSKVAVWAIVTRRSWRHVP
jgi:hypothetical protein